MILNVNVPDLPWSSIKGFWVTHLGAKHAAKPIVKEHDPRGRKIYWIGTTGDVADKGEGTDFHAIDQGFVSVTPIHSDLTHYQAIDDTVKWLES